MTRKDHILAVAAQLFAERGYNNVGMDDLGAAIGVTGPALYYYFKGKAQLLTELLLPSSRELAENAIAIVETSDSGLDALAGLVREHVSFVVQHPSLAIVHAHELRHLSKSEQAQVRTTMRGYVSTWAAVVDGVSPDLDLAEARALVQGVFAMINGMPLEHLSATGHDVASFITTLMVATLEAFVTGLAPLTVPPPATEVTGGGHGVVTPR
ncbi:MAG TPA: TetR/AcrR family transcriptional regulator [Amycolatopsis sp.]|nr:TetR/AcrR family transcriptional regulator [Amycolatopsis sp.]